MRTKDPNKAPRADSFQCYLCDECNHLHLALLDDKDGVIATATIPREGVENMMKIINARPPGERVH